MMLCGIKTFVSVTFIASLIGFARALLVCENSNDGDNRRKFMQTK